MLNESSGPKKAHAFAILVVAGFIAAVCWRMFHAKGISISNLGSSRSQDPSDWSGKRASDATALSSNTDASKDPKSGLPRLSLVTWSQVPDEIALLRVGIAPTNTRSPRRYSQTWFEFISSLRTEARAGAPQEKTDLWLRAAGYCAALDFIILRAAGFKQTDIRLGDKYYFPHVMYSLDNAPTPEIGRSQLLAILENPDKLLKAVPEQFQEPQTVDALRSRALTLLSQYGDSLQIRSMLTKQLDQANTPSTQIAAAGALLSIGAEEKVASWLKSQSGPQAVALTFRVLSGYEIEHVFNDDPQQGGDFLTHSASGGRSLDEFALSLAEDPNNRDLLPSAVSVLSTRVDNPKIRDFISRTINTTTDPEIAVAIFNAQAPLGNDPGYQAAIRTWLASTNRNAQLSALSASGATNMTDQLQLAAPFLTMNDPSCVCTALESLNDTGARDPQLVLQMLSTIPEAIQSNARVKFCMGYLGTRMHELIEDKTQIQQGIDESAKKGYKPLPR